MNNLIMATLFAGVIDVASCAVVPTKQTIYQNLIACTQSTVDQATRDKAVQCLSTSTPNTYAACLEPLAITWTASEIECVAANYEQASKSDGGTIQ